MHLEGRPKIFVKRRWGNLRSGCSTRIDQDGEVGWGGVQGSKIEGVDEAMEVSRKFVAENMKQ